MFGLGRRCPAPLDSGFRRNDGGCAQNPEGRFVLPPTSSSFLLAAILTTNISSFPSFGILSILVQSAPACTIPSPLMPKGELKGV